MSYVVKLPRELPSNAVTADDVRTWAPVASAVFAAAAATAAWFAVRLNHRQWIVSQRPMLQLQACRRQQTGKIELMILNAGGGLARSVGFCIVVGEEYALGFAGPNMGGFLGPGERVVVATDFNSTATDVKGVVGCHDAQGQFHAWEVSKETHGIWKGRSARRLNGQEAFVKAFKKFYPSVDLDGVRRVSGNTPRSQFNLPE